MQFCQVPVTGSEAAAAADAAAQVSVCVAAAAAAEQLEARMAREIGKILMSWQETGREMCFLVCPWPRASSLAGGL